MKAKSQYNLIIKLFIVLHIEIGALVLQNLSKKSHRILVHTNLFLNL